MSKIAVIPGCQHCPYKAIDSTMGIVQQENGEWIDHNYDVQFCGYHLGHESYDNDNRYWLIIEPYLKQNNDDFNRIIKEYPTEWMKPMPDNCPLPEGTDRNE